MDAKKSIAYYISAHGYGHGVRATDVVRAVTAAEPGVPVEFLSTLPAPFLENRLGRGPYRFRRAAYDVGMVQLDSIRVDVPATLRAIEEIYAGRERLVEEGVTFCRERNVGLVVADIPAIPLEIARRAGVPGVAIANFSWDWIYGAFAGADPRWARIVGLIEEGYRRADLLLRLPMYAPMRAFPRVEDIPLVASPGRARRAELAELTGARPDVPWVLLSFTSLDLDDRALDRIEQADGYAFFTVKPLAWRRKNIHAVDRERIPFSDVLASADIVVSKPGFGLVSECVVNRKPLVYAERTDFREYPVLEDAVRRCLRSVHVPAGRLYEGRLAEALDAVRRAPEPRETLPAGGAPVAAKRMLGLLRG